jgi:hypothetical protein
VSLYSPRRPFGVAPDLELGELASGHWGNFGPVIADFLTDDHARLAQRKAEIEEEEWRRAEERGREYMERNGGKTRDGRPLECWSPAG